MFEGRMDKTAWQRPEFKENNPKFDNIPQKMKTTNLVFFFPSCSTNVALQENKSREWI